MTVEIENNLRSMKSRKSELDQEAIDAKKALERCQNQNASLNSAAEALKKQIQGFEDIPEKELSETMEYLETEKAETSKLREKYICPGTIISESMKQYAPAGQNGTDGKGICLDPFPCGYGRRNIKRQK